MGVGSGHVTVLCQRRRRSQIAVTPWCLGVLVVCLLALSATAQPFALDWQTFDGGGGTSSGRQYAVSGTIGQPGAGLMTSGNYTLQGGFWSDYLAIQTPGAPTLTIKRVGDIVEISWPLTGSTGFVPEETTSLAPTINWLNASTTPVVVESQNVVTLPVQPGQHFFRLRKPAE